MSLEIAKLAIQAAQDKKASNIVVLDLNGRSDVCDYQFVCSGENEKQTVAIADAIEAICRTEARCVPSAIEGKNSGHWISMDYGSLIVHVFVKSLRDYYAIESIWPNAVMKL